MTELLTIGELARRTGVTTVTLRYYDELGLVRPTQRVSGHRRYDERAVSAVGVVRLMQGVGFSLAEMRLIQSRERSPAAWRELDLGDEFLEANPPEMATLLGRTDFFSTTTPTSGGVDYREFAKTAAISKR